MSATDRSPVRGVGVVTTGYGSLHAEHVNGTHKPSLWWVAMSTEWISVPLHAFVIEHERGLVLFDTGIDPASTDPAYWPDPVTRWFLDHVFRFDVGPDDRLGPKLTEAGYRPEDVRTVVFSHLHFDHVGGIADVPDAELLVAPDAWDHLVRTPHPHREFVPRPDILRPGARWDLLRFEPTHDPDLAPFTRACDVMGDGSLMVVPTPGHIAGAVSMLIRRGDAPPILLVGDLTHSADRLMADQVAATGDADTLHESFAKVRAMKALTPELVIVASHDPAAADLIAGARSTSPAMAGSSA